MSLAKTTVLAALLVVCVQANEQESLNSGAASLERPKKHSAYPAQQAAAAAAAAAWPGNPWAANPYAAAAVNPGIINPYAAAVNPAAYLPNPYTAAAINPYNPAAVNPAYAAAVNPYAAAALNPYGAAGVYAAYPYNAYGRALPSAGLPAVPGSTGVLPAGAVHHGAATAYPHYG